jgi:hypothetical protein
MPGQKSIRLAKKGGGPSFLNAGFRSFSPAIPLPPRLFAETKRGDLGGISRPFLASAPAFLPGQQENGSQRPTDLKMIQPFLCAVRTDFFCCHGQPDFVAHPPKNPNPILVKEVQDGNVCRVRKL